MAMNDPIAPARIPKKREIFRIVKGKVILDLHPGQSEGYQSETRITAIFAGTQAGKTSFGPWWVYKQLLKYGEGDYIAATATFDLFKLKMLPEIRLVFEDILKIGRFWSGDRVIELKDPDGQFWAKRADDQMYARIILRSAQSKGGLESATATAAWCDEAGQDAFTLDAWEAIQRRVSITEGPILITTTLYNRGWMKQKVYDRWKKGDKSIKVIQFPSYLNPAFKRREYERAKEDLPKWKFNMFYRGEYDIPEGLIYQPFNEEVAILDPFPLNPEWPRYVGLDFGPINTAALWIAEEYVNINYSKYYVYREYLCGNKSTEKHCRDLLNLSTGEMVVLWCGGSKSEKQNRWDFQQFGIPVKEPAITDVEAGIDRVYSLHAKDQIFVFNTCTRYIDEKTSYARKLDANGEPTDEIEDKHSFHIMDAERYIFTRIVKKQKFVGIVGGGYRDAIEIKQYS